MKSPTPPTPPDPQVVSNAQTGSNVATATANTRLGNANETNPYGSVKYKINGYKKIGGQRVPQYERITTLNAAQQQLLDQQNALGSQMNTMAGNQLTRLDSTLSQPISADGLPQVQNSIESRDLQTGYDSGGDIQRQVGANDFSADRQRVEQALYDRINPQLDRDRAAMETKLANQGVRPGSEAWREALALDDRSRNDARLAITAQGGQEQSRLFGMDVTQGEFANQAQAQQHGQNAGQAAFYNQAQTQGFDMDRAAAEFGQTSRERALQEQMSLRNQPINEISALMSGGQVTAPQFSPYKGGNIAGTDVAGNYWNNFNGQMQGYNAKVANQNAMMGGIAGLAGSIFAAPMTGGGSLGGNFFGGLR